MLIESFPLTVSTELVGWAAKNTVTATGILVDIYTATMCELLEAKVMIIGGGEWPRLGARGGVE